MLLPLLRRLQVMVISLHLLTLSASDQPTPGCLSLGCWRQFGVGRETKAGLHVSGDTLYHGSGGPWKDHGCWVYEPGRWCSGPSARVRMQLGPKAKSRLSWLHGYKSCSALLAGGGPHPRLRSSPRTAPGGTKQETQVCQALQVVFFPQDSTKKGNEKRPPSWLRFALEGCFLPAALLLCCNTGNLLLLTPGVVSNSQMVLTSVSCNWWPTCLTLQLSLTLDTDAASL